MFLKSLDIFGFKSFADRTHIEFSDGITALLGPNGCGKSNVVDAVKWVLGEQGAKNMRAEKMEDIIFNGTESRKALNVAEVTLTICNEQGLLPLDVSEITIKRRLFRSGEGEYWINGTQAKLKDVRELFWDTGVGKAAYSVMEQGKIDQILSNRPEDRRYIFEEAAGITRFKARRAEAERKLERTEENMKQVDGILQEVKKSYDTLKVQAEKTEQYRSLKEKVFDFERDLQLVRLKGFILDQHNKKESLTKSDEKRRTLSTELKEIQDALSEHMDTVNTMQSEVAALQQKIYGLAIQKQEKVNQNKQLLERQTELKQKVAQLEGRKSALENNIENLTEETDNKEADIHELRRRVDDVAKNIARFEADIQLATGHITDNDTLAKKIQDEILVLDDARRDLQKELEAITDDIVTQLDSRLKDAGYSSAERQKAEDALMHVLAELKIKAGGRSDILKDFAQLKSPSAADIKNLTDKAVSAFTEVAELVDQVEEAVKVYTRTTPQFIDDFLSPEGIITKKRAIDARVDENRAKVEEKRQRIDGLKSENADLVTKIDDYKATLQDLKLNQTRMGAQITAQEEALRLVRRELAGQEAALRELESELYTEQKRYEETEDLVLENQGEIDSIERQGLKLTEELTELEESIENRNSDVAGKRKLIEQKNKEIASLSQQIELLNLELATAETEVRNIKENFRESHGRDLMEFEERMYVINTPAAQMREDLASVRQQLKNIGNVNLMAVEEFAETKERYDFLSTQLEDLRKARDDLNRITEEIRAESTQQFLDTYNKIKKNFHNMFRRLFGGGRAELRLVDPQNVLESGIDILAQPPGKKLENIALLSGGEKTMTAVSLLFATYMVRPSPFCLLDEIDAALDEQNVLRFVQTLREFGNISQYIVITHNKKTVAGAGTMLGVTMEESGISKVITIKLEENGRIVLPEPEPFEEEDVEPETDVYIPPRPPKRDRTRLSSNLIVETANKTEETDNQAPAQSAVNSGETENNE